MRSCVHGKDGAHPTDRLTASMSKYPSRTNCGSVPCAIAVRMRTRLPECGTFRALSKCALLSPPTLSSSLRRPPMMPRASCGTAATKCMLFFVQRTVSCFNHLGTSVRSQGFSQDLNLTSPRRTIYPCYTRDRPSCASATSPQTTTYSYSLWSKNIKRTETVKPAAGTHCRCSSIWLRNPDSGATASRTTQLPLWRCRGNAIVLKPQTLYQNSTETSVNAQRRDTMRTRSLEPSVCMCLPHAHDPAPFLPGVRGILRELPPLSQDHSRRHSRGSLL